MFKVSDKFLHVPAFWVSALWWCVGSRSAWNNAQWQSRHVLWLHFGLTLGRLWGAVGLCEHLERLESHWKQQSAMFSKLSWCWMPGIDAIVCNIFSVGWVDPFLWTSSATVQDMHGFATFHLSVYMSSTCFYTDC